MMNWRSATLWQRNKPKKKKHFILKDTKATSIIEKNCLPRARRRHHLLLLADDDHRDAQRFCWFFYRAESTNVVDLMVHSSL
jgi:hypothetical protein